MAHTAYLRDSPQRAFERRFSRTETSATHLCFHVCQHSIVMDGQTPPYLRLFSWWMILQCWCTLMFLKFRDHRGVSPTSVTIQGTSLSATLNWSKTIGADKTTRSRQLTVESNCHIHHSDWLSIGWLIAAPFSRDFFLPGPAKALTGCTKAELRLDAACAMQSRLMYILPAYDGILFTQCVPRFGHNIRTEIFYPAHLLALGFSKADRDVLSGWQEEVTCTLAGRLKITNIQRAVVQAIQVHTTGDPLGEEESTIQLKAFMTEMQIPQPKIPFHLGLWLPTRQFRLRVVEARAQDRTGQTTWLLKISWVFTGKRKRTEVSQQSSRSTALGANLQEQQKDTTRKKDTRKPPERRKNTKEREEKKEICGGEGKKSAKFCPPE